MRFFNTAGPCRPEYHYMLPPLERFDPSVNVERLIAQQSYFVVHAPRQTGKTTTMQALAKELTESGQCISVLLSMEVGAAFGDDPGAAERAIVDEWYDLTASILPAEFCPPKLEGELVDGRIIGAFLTNWARHAPWPLVLFLDEIDALQDSTLISALRQFRSGYTRRPEGFPASIALIGLRDVRDYKIASGGSGHLGTFSPFNIAVRSITLENFNATDVANLLQQHTAETGQQFQNESVALIYELTQGQPWLVNALAKLCAEELVPDTGQMITTADVDKAKEILIQRRQTHLDSLADKLREPRVQAVIEPLLAGGYLDNIPVDDLDYVVDLGLVRYQNGQGLEVANPIYREVIPRALASLPQSNIPSIQPSWLNKDGTLNTSELLEAFLTFWRQHGQPLLKSVSYHEIAPHLVLMAFLHRVVNGNGTIEREYAIGSRRMDLCLRYGDTTLGIELKVWREGERDPLEAGLEQIDDYLAGLGQNNGWLVIFDQRPNQPPIYDRTTATETESKTGRTITVIRA